MRLFLDDGYSLTAKTEETVRDLLGNVIASGLPVVEFTYRPALPEALAEWRHSLRMAKDGAGEFRATANFVAGHLCSWNVVLKGGAAAPIDADTIGKVPEPILDQIVQAVATWKPGQDEKNS